VKTRLIWLLILMVVIPLTLLAVLGVRGARETRASRQRQINDVLATRLNDIDARIRRVLERIGQGLVRLTDSARPPTPDNLRALVRLSPRIDGIFLQAEDGMILHPPLEDGISENERSFLRRTRQILEDRLLLTDSHQADSGSSEALPSVQSDFRKPYSWYPWYWDRGLHLIFFRRLPSGAVIGAEINQMRLLADILDELSDITTDVDDGRETVSLLDSSGRILQRWGKDLDHPTAEVSMHLGAPLSAWKLTCSYRAGNNAPVAATLAWFLAFFLAAAGLIGLAVGLYRGSTRELREAARRVNFVNQVSHELRTPLTNIRLYAELLQERLGEKDEKTRRHLAVIVAESHRLSRLIGNVLSFGRHRRGLLRLRARRTSLPDVLVSTVDGFRPAFEEKGITVRLDVEDVPAFDFDPDAFEQILGNLFNNVEKYAADGGWIDITLEKTPGYAVIIIQDNGSGIPEDQWERVFEPFVRLKNQLTEGVAGTGIGLALSRDLARLHGGDLSITPSRKGTRFRLTLPVKAASG